MLEYCLMIVILLQSLNTFGRLLERHIWNLENQETQGEGLLMAMKKSVLNAEVAVINAVIALALEIDERTGIQAL